MMRTARSSAMVTTSPARAGWLAAEMRSLLRRTLPAVTSAAAAVRVRTTRACHSHLSMRWRAIYRSLFRLELFLQRGELGERRVRIGLAAPFLRIDPLARFATVAILEIAPALAARTVAALPVRAVAAAALTLLRTGFAVGPLALGSIPSVAGALVRTVRLRLGHRRRCFNGCHSLRAILRRRLGVGTAVGPLTPFALRTWRTGAALFGRAARAP